MSKVKEQIEALIFAFGDGITMQELAKRTKSDAMMVRRAVTELNNAYSERKSAFSIINEGDMYRMRLRQDLGYLVEDSLKTDLKRGVLMTLSVIASHGKMKQAELVNLRGSISYQHVRELEERGLVSSHLENNRKVIKLTSTFFDYFDVNNKEFSDMKTEIKTEETKAAEQNVEYTGN